MASVHFPLDPLCSGVQMFSRNTKDSLDRRAQLLPEERHQPEVLATVIREWTEQHRARCERCQKYGRANLVRLA